MSETRDWSVAGIEGESVPDVWIVLPSPGISDLPDDIFNGGGSSI